MFFNKKRSKNPISALKNIEFLKNNPEKYVKLSQSQIVSIITNMMDAKENLPIDLFEKVYSLYNKYHKEDLLIPLNYKQYTEFCFSVIGEFEEIAPYTLFDGNLSNPKFLNQEDIDEQLQNHFIKKQTDWLQK